MRKRIDHWCAEEIEKSKPMGPPLQLKIHRALFSTGMLEPQDEIFLSPLNTDDGFFLSLDTM